MCWLLWPFELLWRLLALVVELTGRLAAVLFGAILVTVGAVLCFTIIGAVVGIPLIAVGLALIARGIF